MSGKAGREPESRRVQVAHTCLPGPSLCTFLHHSHRPPVPHTMDGIDFTSYLPPSKDSQLLKERQSFLSVHCQGPEQGHLGCQHGLVGPGLGAHMAWWEPGLVKARFHSWQGAPALILDTSTQIPHVHSQKKVLFFQSLDQDAEDLSP